MGERWRFQFSVANVLLATFAVAWILGGVTLRLRVGHSSIASAAFIALVVVAGISMTVGGLVGGFKGMTRGFIVGTCVLLAVAIVACMLIVTWVVILESLGGVQ